MSDVSVFVIFSFTAADSRVSERGKESERDMHSDGNCRQRRHCKLDKLMEMLHVNGKLSYEENWTLT